MKKILFIILLIAHQIGYSQLKVENLAPSERSRFGLEKIKAVLKQQPKLSKQKHQLRLDIIRNGKKENFTIVTKSNRP